MDLYGNTKSTNTIEPVVEDGIKFGLKDVKVEGGIFYGLFLCEEGEKGVVRKLEIPASLYAVE